MITADQFTQITVDRAAGAADVWEELVKSEVGKIKTHFEAIVGTLEEASASETERMRRLEAMLHHDSLTHDIKYDRKVEELLVPLRDNLKQICQQMEIMKADQCLCGEDLGSIAGKERVIRRIRVLVDRAASSREGEGQQRVITGVRELFARPQESHRIGEMEDQDIQGVDWALHMPHQIPPRTDGSEDCMRYRPSIDETIRIEEGEAQPEGGDEVSEPPPGDTQRQRSSAPSSRNRGDGELQPEEEGEEQSELRDISDSWLFHDIGSELVQHTGTSTHECFLLFLTSKNARAHVKGVTIEAWLDQ